MKKWEKFVQPMNGHSLSGQYTPSVHGTSGPIQITINNYEFGADARVIAAASQVSGISYSEWISRYD